MEPLTNDSDDLQDSSSRTGTVNPNPREAPGPSRRSRLWIGGLLAIMVAAGTVWAVLVWTNPSDARVQEAKAVVEQYLSSLRTGDAVAAKACLEEPLGVVPGIDPWPALSREILQASNDIAPIHDFDVGEPSKVWSNTYEVPARIVIGGQSHERTFTVSTKDGAFITDGLVTVDSRALTASGLRVNGETVNARILELAPGGYRFEAKFEAFDLPNAPEAMILVDDAAAEGFAEATRPVLTAAGEEQFRDLIAGSLEQCMAWDLGETECGLHAVLTQQDYESRGSDKTIHRALSPEIEAEIRSALETLEPVESPSVPGVYTIGLPPVDPWTDVTVSIVREGETDRTVVAPQSISNLKQPSVDFSRFVPQVSWR